MYSNSDLEKLWFLYTTEGEPKGISLNSFSASHATFNASTPLTLHFNCRLSAIASERTDWQNLTPAKIYVKI